MLRVTREGVVPMSPRADRRAAVLALCAAALLSALVAGCGGQAVTEGKTGSPSPAPPTPTPSTWPEALGGTWVDDLGQATGDDPVTIEIGQRDGHASITTRDARGRYFKMIFTPTKITFMAPGWEESVSAPLWRPGSSAFTGTYRGELPYGPLTLTVAYGDRFLLLSGSRVLFSGDIIGNVRESFSCKDGQVLTHEASGMPHETMTYTRQSGLTASAF